MHLTDITTSPPIRRRRTMTRAGRNKEIAFALGTAIVLAERGLMPGPVLIKEWKKLVPKET